MKKIISYILVLFSVLSCIENDLSYPTVESVFETFEVEGAKSVTINKQNRTIEIVLGESQDISDVVLKSYTVSNNAQVIDPLPGRIDLREPIEVVLRTYQDYKWTITASQTIERYIHCENQIGEAEINLEDKIAYVYVSEDQDLESLLIKEMKLEPEGSVVEFTIGYVSENGVNVSKTEACNFPMTLDCVLMRYFYVLYNNQSIKWSVKFIRKQVEMKVSSVQPWTYSADVQAITKGDAASYLEYCVTGAAEWIKFDDIKLEGKNISATLTGLKEATSYQVRVSNGTEASSPVEFSTSSAVQLANLNFDDWSKGNKYPNAEGVDIWDSANSSGAAVTTSPVEDAVSGKAAMLETVTAFGMLAAGNIFTGSFVGLAGLGAELDWGTPFTARPSALKGYFKYSPKTIDKAKDPYKDKIGETDQCQILVALTDWDGPFRVNTNEKKFVDFDTDPGVIAYGVFNTSDNVTEYKEVRIPLEYRSTERTPKYIVIAAAASRYGDYFTGGVGSVLHIDEFELEYK